MTLPAPEAIIFDWDNTLVNTWPIIHDALAKTFEAMGQEAWPIETTMSRVRKSMRDSFPELFGERWEEASGIYQAEYRANHLKSLEALVGAEELLDQIQARGIPAVVVSNKKGPSLRLEVGHLGWGKYFDSIIGADDAARDKPFPDPVLLALSQIEREPGPEVWFIGDSDIDLECAQNTGCTPILYGPLARAHEEFSASHYLGMPYASYAADHAALMVLLG